MSASPQDLLSQHARSKEESRKVTVRIPLELLREVWRHGVATQARSEGESLVAALRDWLIRRRPEPGPQERPAANQMPFLNRAQVADLARECGLVVFNPDDIDLTEAGLRLEASLHAGIEEVCRRWVADLTCSLRRGQLPARPTP